MYKCIYIYVSVGPHLLYAKITGGGVTLPPVESGREADCLRRLLGPDRTSLKIPEAYVLYVFIYLLVRAGIHTSL